MISNLRQIAIACLLSFLLPAIACAQQVVLQGGPTTNGHVPMYITQGTQPYVMDSGTAGGGAANIGLSELLIAQRGLSTPPFANGGSGPLYTNFCDYDGPTNSVAGYHYLCFSPNASGGGLIAYGYNGSTGPLNLSFNINGSVPLILSSTGVTLATPTITGGTITGATFTGGTISGAAISGGSISGATISQALTNAHLFVGNGSNIAADVAMTGDASIANTGSVTVSKTGGVAFGTSATVNTGTSGATIPLLNGANVWSGNQSLSGVSFTSTGAMVLSTFVVTSGASYNTAATDYFIAVNKGSGSATTINLPSSPATGRFLIITDGKGDAQTNNITITNGTINGAASVVLRSNYASVTLIYNGTAWNAL